MFTKVNAKDLEEFLRLVVEGEQNEAEAILTNNPALALESGDVTDLSKRMFRGITGFQYAVWALDWHMWTMIRKYLPDEAARKQAQGFATGSWTREYGVNAGWLLENLIDALKSTIDLFTTKKLKQSEATWQREVCGAQINSPAHVVNEYCHPTRPFEPLPNFKDTLVLPRTRNIFGSEWFAFLGQKHKLFNKECKYGAVRGDMSYCSAGTMVTGAVNNASTFFIVACASSTADIKHIISDRASLGALCNTRTAQRDELIIELQSIPAVFLKPLEQKNPLRNRHYEDYRLEPVARTTVYSMADPRLPINYDNWVVSIMRKPNSKNPEHAFLVIEGINQFGKGILIRCDLVDDRENPGNARILDNSLYNIEPDQLKTTFCKELMKQEKFYHISWSISRTQAGILREDINRDREQTIKYCISGSNSVFVKSTSANSHSCFTWAREKLHNLGDERIQLPESSIDLICAQTSFYINGPDTEMKKGCCTLL